MPGGLTRFWRRQAEIRSISCLILFSFKSFNGRLYCIVVYIITDQPRTFCNFLTVYLYFAIFCLSMIQLNFSMWSCAKAYHLFSAHFSLTHIRTYNSFPFSIYSSMLATAVQFFLRCQIRVQFSTIVCFVHQITFSALLLDHSLHAQTFSSVSGA